MCGGDSTDLGDLVRIGYGASDGGVGRVASLVARMSIIWGFFYCVAWCGLCAAKA